MTFIDLENEPQYRKKVTAALERRGLVPVFDEEWSTHGPDSDKVYVGYATTLEDGPNDSVCVAIYKRGVYEIDDPSSWEAFYTSDPEKKIQTLPQPVKGERRLSVKQLAERLNVSANTITRMVERGDIPALKVGRQWRFDGTEVEKHLAQKKK